jgi:hypothetical protein
MAFGFGLGITANPPLNLTQQALAILRSYGTNAHAYIPGIGTLSGLTAGNYLLADGSTGLTPVDGLQGLVLDGMGSVGSELVVNGALTSADGWTVVGVDGTHTATFSAAGCRYQSGTTSPQLVVAQAVALTSIVAGKTYQFTFTISNWVSGAVKSDQFLAGGSWPQANGTYTYTAVCNNGGNFSLTRSTTSVDLTVSNISIKEVTGIHATSSGAARPTLRRGLVNLALSSQNLVNAAWAPVGDTTVTENRATFPTGGFGNPVRQNFNFSSGAPYTIALDCKAISGSATGTLDLQNGEGGAFTAPTSRGIVVCSITPGAARTWVDIQLDAAGVMDVYAFGLFQGTLTAAQILAEGGIPLTTTAAASNAAAGRYSSQFSGAQYVATGSPVCQATDDICVVAGAICTEVATGYRVIFNPAGDTGNNYSYGAIVFELTTGKLFSSFSTPTGSITLFSTTNDTNAVLVASIRTAGNTRVLRKNGTLLATSTNSIGASSYTSSSIGSNVSGVYGSRFIGSLGPVIAIKGTVSDAELLTLERWVSSLTPNGPAF